MSELPIKPDKDFEEFFNLNEIDKKILNGALNINSGQSVYQSKYFVANSQLTPYRMIKQCLLELEARHHSWFNIKNKLKRKKIEIKIALRKISETNDDLEKQLIEVDIEDMQHDVDVWERKILQAAEEVYTYLNIVKEIAKDNEELIEKSFTYDEQEETKYWVTRMAKQAAMDMIAYGRIGSGNMDSIAMMPEEDQVKTLATTIQYNERLTKALHQISKSVSDGLLQNTENLPKYDVPAITDQLMIGDLINDDIQCSPQSKVEPESI